jgi:hypothetical protein
MILLNGAVLPGHDEIQEYSPYFEMSRPNFFTPSVCEDRAPILPLSCSLERKRGSSLCEISATRGLPPWCERGSAPSHLRWKQIKNDALVGLVRAEITLFKINPTNVILECGSIHVEKRFSDGDDPFLIVDHDQKVCDKVYQTLCVEESL